MSELVRPLVHKSMLMPQDVVRRWLEARRHNFEGFHPGVQLYPKIPSPKVAYESLVPHFNERGHSHK